MFSLSVMAIIESTAVESIYAYVSDCEIVLRKGGVDVKKASSLKLDIYSPSGEKVKTVRTVNTPLFVSLDPALYIIANQKFLIDRQSCKRTPCASPRVLGNYLKHP